MSPSSSKPIIKAEPTNFQGVAHARKRRKKRASAPRITSGTLAMASPTNLITSAGISPKLEPSGSGSIRKPWKGTA